MARIPGGSRKESVSIDKRFVARGEMKSSIGDESLAKDSGNDFVPNDDFRFRLGHLSLDPRGRPVCFAGVDCSKLNL
jgi:hypothetical protein